MNYLKTINGFGRFPSTVRYRHFELFFFTTRTVLVLDCELKFQHLYCTSCLLIIKYILFLISLLLKLQSITYLCYFQRRTEAACYRYGPRWVNRLPWSVLTRPQVTTALCSTWTSRKTPCLPPLKVCTVLQHILPLPL